MKWINYLLGAVVTALLARTPDEGEPLNVPLILGGTLFGLGIAALVWALISQRRRTHRR